MFSSTDTYCSQIRKRNARKSTNIIVQIVEFKLAVGQYREARRIYDLTIIILQELTFSFSLIPFTKDYFSMVQRIKNKDINIIL